MKNPESAAFLHHPEEWPYHYGHLWMTFVKQPSEIPGAFPQFGQIIYDEDFKQYHLGIGKCPNAKLMEPVDIATVISDGWLVD